MVVSLNFSNFRNIILSVCSTNRWVVCAALLAHFQQEIHLNRAAKHSFEWSKELESFYCPEGKGTNVTRDSM